MTLLTDISNYTILQPPVRVETSANFVLSGLGEVICLQFGAAGSNVVINFMSSEDRARSLASEIEREYGVKVFIVQGVSE